MATNVTDRAAIVGVGTSGYSRTSQATPLDLAAVAIREALSDAELAPGDIDGIVTNVGSPRGVDFDLLCHRLNLSARYSVQTWSHGRFAGTCVQTAAMAVICGLADTVAVVRTSKSSKRAQFGGEEDLEGSREGGGPHGELPHYGLTAPASGAAMAARLYMHRYGVPDGALGAVATSFRRHAALNPRAVFQQEIDEADYASSPMLIEPLRRHDFSVSADGAICILVRRAAEALAASRPVVLAGMQGLQGGRQEFVFGRPGLGVQQQERTSFRPSSADQAAMKMAGLGVNDIGAFYTYDAFSPLVWFALERFGFCAEGEAAAFCSEGHISLGGSLPVNTNGGLLSEGHLSGFNHMLEMVSQLRGEAGPRQVPGIETAMWGTCFGDALVMCSPDAAGKQPRRDLSPVR